MARRGEALSPTDRGRFAELVERRKRREPYQYLTGEQEFYGLAFRVDRRVLVPRPETEELVTAVLRSNPRRGARVADLGTGSGCIAVAIAHERPDLALYAIEQSEGALEVARENAAQHAVDERVHFVLGDLAHPPAEWSGVMDVVVSNPPYVSEEEWGTLAPEVRDWEPKGALVPGPTGVEAYHALAPAVFQILRPAGVLFLELGYRSEVGVRDVLAAAGFQEAEVFPDLRGIPRVLRARRQE